MVPGADPPLILNWHAPRHYDRGPLRPCQLCGEPTPLRDAQWRPSHKVCAEAAEARRAAAIATTYRRTA